MSAREFPPGHQFGSEGIEKAPQDLRSSLHLGRKIVALPGTMLTVGGKEVEVFTMEDKGAANYTYEIMFIDKETQANIAIYSVTTPKFKEKGFVYDVQSFFDSSIADFKRLTGA